MAFFHFISDKTERFQFNPVSNAAEAAKLSIPEKTKEKALWAHRILTDWWQWRSNSSQESDTNLLLHSHSSILSMTDGELDMILANFIREVRNRKGQNYNGDTKYQIITSLQKYFEIHGRQLKLINVKEMPTLYYSLDVAMKESNNEGLGMTTKRAEAIDEDQENVLWNKGILGEWLHIFGLKGPLSN